MELCLAPLENQELVCRRPKHDDDDHRHDVHCQRPEEVCLQAGTVEIFDERRNEETGEVVSKKLLGVLCQGHGMELLKRNFPRTPAGDLDVGDNDVIRTD